MFDIRDETTNTKVTQMATLPGALRQAQIVSRRRPDHKITVRVRTDSNEYKMLIELVNGQRIDKH